MLFFFYYKLSPPPFAEGIDAEQVADKLFWQMLDMCDRDFLFLQLFQQLVIC